jgi:CRP-like cAMP-binding protein
MAMKDIYEVVKPNPLWDGVGFGEFEGMNRCMDSRIRKYGKGETVLLSGDSVSKIGVIASGSVKIIKEDADGNDFILTELGVPDLFGETFVCAGIARSPVTVQASAKSEILFLDYRKVITSCPSACAFHTRLIENMIKLLARKNLLLNQKIDILSKRTTREKLIAFFDTQRGASRRFAVPYNREEMARYLCVDRSAMSNELCKMRDEGLIRFNRNEFEIASR